MKISVLHPAADLKHLISGYYLLEDPEGLFTGDKVLSAPRPVNCMCVQLGDMVATDFRDHRPRMSIGGIQARIRHFQPLGSARSLLIFPTQLGSIRFMPHEGETLFDEGYDIGGLIGDGPVLSLQAAASAAPDTAAIARVTDAWLRARFEKVPERPDHVRLAQAMDLVGRGQKSVASAAMAKDLSERQLERSFLTHLGLSPKRYQQIVRVTRSLQSVMTGKGDGMEGYADQAHQIRSWKTFLGTSPGEFRRNGLTRHASLFNKAAPETPEDWVQFV